MADDTDVIKEEFRRKVQKRPGEWDFAGFYAKPDENPVNSRAIEQQQLTTIVNGTVDELRCATYTLNVEYLKEKMGRFVEQHELPLREYAVSITSKKNNHDAWMKSIHKERTPYNSSLDRYNEFINRVIKDFKAIADKANPRASAEILNAWTKDNELLSTLDEVFRLSDVPDRFINKDLDIINNAALSEKIKSAYASARPILETLQRMIQQKAEAQQSVSAIR